MPIIRVVMKEKYPIRLQKSRIRTKFQSPTLFLSLRFKYFSHMLNHLAKEEKIILQKKHEICFNYSIYENYGFLMKIMI